MFWIKSKNGTLTAPSAPQMKSFGPKKFQIPCMDQKRAILAIFLRGPGWLGPNSAALKNPSQDFKNSFLLGADELLAMLGGSIRVTPFF